MKKFLLALADGLLELAIAVLFFGIGVLVLRLFGVDFDILNTDGELIVLVGIVAFALVFAVAFLVIKSIKGKRRSAREDTETKKD